MMKISEKVKKQHEEILEKSFSIMIRTIRESNNIDYKSLDILEEYYDWYDHESFIGIIIFESYSLLQRIKKHKITDDNYVAKETKFENAKKKMEALSAMKLEISMLPKPSIVIYALKYYLHHHFKIDKAITKHIIEVVAEKKQNTIRMPKNNPNHNQMIEISEEINDHMFNTHEGREKMKYMDVSIFKFLELKTFRKLVYNRFIQDQIVKEIFVTI